MTLDDFVVTGVLLEQNTLEKNMQLLAKISRYRRFNNDLIVKMLDELRKVKKNRNLFIHGIWSEPYEEENDIMITCSDRKIQYEKLPLHSRWVSAAHHKFRIGYIKKQVLLIDEIILRQNHLIKELKENRAELD